MNQTLFLTAAPATRFSTISWVLAACLLAAFGLAPILLSEFWLHVINEILILGLFAMSFNLIFGYMGQISFGHAAFFGVGAYTTAILIRTPLAATGDIGWGVFLLALFAAPAAAGLVAAVVGWFCVRLTGIYFAILTLSFGELLYYIVFQWYSFTNGDDGIQGLRPPEELLATDAYYYFTFAAVAAAALLMYAITRSPFGFTLRALRDNQRRAAFLGINVKFHQWLNFVIAGAFAGFAGGLWGPFSRSVAPSLLGWQKSGEAVFAALIGGAGYFLGPLLGSSVFTFLHAFVTKYTEFWPLAIGTVILLLVLFLPGGLLSLLPQRLVESQERVENRQNSSSSERGHQG
ncbi:branched-chain amino acid ABC transporter permease [Roseibium sp. M-1]